jgi:chromosome segregation ATPase
VSTPTEAKQARQQRAEQLAEMTANAVAAARIALSNAGLAAEQVNTRLARAENDLAELPRQAGSVLQPDNNPRTHLLNAQSYADDIDRNLRFAQEALEEVRSELARSAQPLGYAKEFLAELESVSTEDQVDAGQQETAGAQQQAVDEELKAPGQVPETAATLRKRLENLEKAVAAATVGVKTTAANLHAARTSLQPLRHASMDHRDREATASLISRTGRSVTSEVQSLNNSLENAHESHHKADEATRAANELAIAVHAGTNPTRPAEQKTPAGSAEDPRKLWAEGRLGPQLDR